MSDENITNEPRKVELITNTPIDGFLRLKDVLKIFPMSKASWWAGIKAGRYPKPVKLGPNMSGWRISDLQELAENFPEVEILN